MLYRSVVRPLLFRLDAETAHHTTFALLRAAACVPGVMPLMRLIYGGLPAGQERTVFGLKFANSVGLAAGLDKDAMVNHHWEAFGFGHMEIGTVTPRPQPGNDRPRLFRLPADRAIINRMGFNSSGVEVIVERLKRVPKHRRIIIGANIGKNKVTDNKDAESDYLTCLSQLFPYVDYFTVNVSSPNTPNLRELQDREPLTKLLKTLQDFNHSQPNPKPILLKIAPDLGDSQLDDILAIARETQLAGLVATNTTISRSGLTTPESRIQEIGAGGLSGAPLTTRSTEVIRYLHTHSQGQIPLIAVGGIMTPADAAAKIAAGASLIQLYTGFVYGGPELVQGINGHIRAIDIPR